MVLALLAFLAAALAASDAHAYIGPGPGFAIGSSLLLLAGALGAGLLSLLGAPLRMVVRALRRRRAGRRARVRRLVVLGFDGLDPELAERWMQEGELPNLKGLAARGSFQRLRTTYPSISPVAWSSFMTGVDPARHNIFDFLNRDAASYQPRLSSCEIGPAQRGPWSRIRRPAVRALRKSRAFWTLLGEHGVPAHVLRVPLSFPPEPFAGVLLSGMCVPDLQGTQGSFAYYTTDPAELLAPDPSPQANAGARRLVVLEGERVRAELVGPPDESGCPPLPFELRVDRARREVELRICGRRHALREREHSPWIRLVFRRRGGGRVYGIARFLVTRLEPQLALYVTPIQIDPAHPLLPISFPFYYSLYLAKRIGDFATLGLAEDTWALDEGVIDEAAFLDQVDDHVSEREAMLENALAVSPEGAIVCVFDSTDRVQHMFFRHLDESSSAGEAVPERSRRAVLDSYRRADAVVGRTFSELGPGDLLWVISDHGFQPFRRGVNLNAWLQRAGLLRLREGALPGDWFAGVDWEHTQAYAFGLAGIYVNQSGREGQGCVAPGAQSAALKERLIDALRGLRDEECDCVAINQVFDSAEVCGEGPYRANAPDLIVGYNRGYRASWEGAMGRVTDAVFCDNTRRWSGDHCVDPRLVPGVLFSSRALETKDPAITDLAPTILDLFGAPVPAHMTGRALAFRGDGGPL